MGQNQGEHGSNPDLDSEPVQDKATLPQLVKESSFGPEKFKPMLEEKKEETKEDTCSKVFNQFSGKLQTIISYTDPDGRPG